MAIENGSPEQGFTVIIMSDCGLVHVSSDVVCIREQYRVLDTVKQGGQQGVPTVYSELVVSKALTALPPQAISPTLMANQQPRRPVK